MPLVHRCVKQTPKKKHSESNIRSNTLALPQVPGRNLSAIYNQMRNVTDQGVNMKSADLRPILVRDAAGCVAGFVGLPAFSPINLKKEQSTI